MLAAEILCQESNLHRIREHVCNDLGVLGAVTDSYETNTLDEEHLRGMATFLYIGFDLLLCLLYEVCTVLGFKIAVVGLALYNLVGCAGRAAGLESLL